MERIYIKSIRPYLKALEPLQAIPTPAKSKIAKGDYKAIIFDIYGTLLISASGDVDKADYSSSMIKKALIAADIEVLIDNNETYDSIYASYNTCIKAHHKLGLEAGRPYPEVDIVEVSKDALKIANDQGLIKLSNTSDIILFNFVFELQTNKIWPMPGMQDLINTLGESALELGIVSNAQFYTPVIMNHLLHDKEIDGSVIAPFNKDLCVYSYQELRGKPDKALFEGLLPHLESLNIKPSEVLYVGNDMLKDMYTSSQVGFKTVFFTGDLRAYRLYENDDRCANFQPDYVITELEQLLQIVNLK